MKTLILIPLLAAALAAQEGEPQPVSPVTEKKLSLTVDTGYRFLNDIQGDFSSYRSVVNLGEGPKLFGVEMDLRDTGWSVLDRLTASAHSWGGDPYNTLRVEAEKSRAYRLTADYRNIAYFNFLPSFANPNLGQGSLINQRSFDVRRRHSSVELELLPARRVTPYLVYSRDSGAGTGITPFVANGNEYPVASALRDSTDHYRGGVRIECRRAHVTLEQGGSVFKDDQHNFTRDRNLGNRSSLLFGQQLLLSDLEQAYGVRGNNVYTKGVLTAAPASWADVYGQFLYSRPNSEVRYSENARGLFFLGVTRFFNGMDSLLASEAKLPRTSGSFGAELRPHRRLRLTESWMTQRFHNAGSALLAEQLLFAASPAEARQAFSLTRLAVNYNRQQADAFVEVARWLTLRGGHRYVWGDAAVPPAGLSPTQALGRGELRQHVGIGGVHLRPGAKLRADIDYEGSPGDRNYFRTSLQNYHLLRARARWQALASLLFTASFRFLDNQNPAQGIAYEFQSRSATAGVEWRPQNARHVSLLGEYTRSALRSDIEFFVPQSFDRSRSFYRDNAHTATALLELRAPGSTQFRPYFHAGGSLFLSSGSRPSQYWQPVGRVHLPFGKQLEAYAEWRWYGLSQAFYLFEGFRTHQFVTGLRMTM